MFRVLDVYYIGFLSGHKVFYKSPPNPDMASHDTPIGATQQSFEIIEALRKMSGGRVSEVAKYVATPTSTVHSHLMTLHELGYVSKRGDMYFIGARFVQLGQTVIEENPAYPDFKSNIEELAEETQERVQFCIEDHGFGVFIGSAEGKHSINTETPVGHRVHLHQTATGKAILSELPETRVNQIIDDRGLPAATTETIINERDLKTELSHVSEMGYAISVQEYMDAVNAIAVPICGKAGQVVGSIGITGPANRLTREHLETEFAEKLLGIASEMEINLKNS